MLDALATNTGAKGLGLDISGTSIKGQLARRGSREHFDAVVASAMQLPVPDNSVNAVIAFDLVEHLEQPERLYAEAARVLKPGGRLLMRMPVMDFGGTLDWLQFHLRRERWLERMTEAGHFYRSFRTKLQHKHFAREAGLRVVYSAGYDIVADNLFEYAILPRLAGSGKQAPATDTGDDEAQGIQLQIPHTPKHRAARAMARILYALLLPERLVGRLGVGASMWLLAIKPE